MSATRYRVVALAVAIVVVLAGCAAPVSPSPPAASATPSTAAGATVASGTFVTRAGDQLGSVLIREARDSDTPKDAGYFVEIDAVDAPETSGAEFLMPFMTSEEVPGDETCWDHVGVNLPNVLASGHSEVPIGVKSPTDSTVSLTSITLALPPLPATKARQVVTRSWPWQNSTGRLAEASVFGWLIAQTMPKSDVEVGGRGDR